MQKYPYPQWMAQPLVSWCLAISDSDMTRYWCSPSDGLDYNSITVTLTFSESTTRQCRDMAIIDDSTYEEDEMFSATLVSDDDVELDPDSGVVTISDNDGGLY